jgi:hypothetical protein
MHSSTSRKLSLLLLLHGLCQTSVPAREPDWLIDRAPFVARASVSSDRSELALSNGLVRRIIRLGPTASTVALDNLMTSATLLRGVRPEAIVEIDGRRFAVGGLTGQPLQNYLNPAWLAEMKPEPQAFQFTTIETGKTRARFAWQQHREWLSRECPWPAPGVAATLHYEAPKEFPGISVEVHYELFDGLPVISKWLTVSNASQQTVMLDRMTVEQLAVVEPESIVDGAAANFRGVYRDLEAFSDYSFGGDMTANADAPAVHWTNDLLYATQVHYERKTPCLLECSPPVGPAQKIAPGSSFTSFRVFELIHDSTDRERRGLALRQAYRALAPWTQENPILMHVRSAKPDAVRLAVDQCAAVGFELVILTFGSGFDIENESPDYLAQLKGLADYARSKGIALGGYSLLASRSINPENDVINPETGKIGGARFGNSPCLGSAWGQDYFRKLRHFYETTGCNVLEHDGSYPGDVCVSTNHPGHLGLADSQWTQWKTITDFYQWCRGRGIYLNVPDWYYLQGSSKCGMGYRESNWSLPREEQEIIERQNVYDGTWEKTPSMGWMFVPLTEYQGGGAAATIEPLKDHLPHYETRLADLFGAGVQACYRGPRLFDSEETKAVVERWVKFYKQHRTILDSDIIHLRRADGRDWDGWLHVNPREKECGLAVFYNPLSEVIERKIRLPLYYTGLRDSAELRWADGKSSKITLERDYSGIVSVRIAARSRSWVSIQRPAARGSR